MDDNNTLKHAILKVKHMASSNLNKQPISLLQEALVTSRCVPNYDLIDASGEPHMRTFTYRAYINDDVTATASDSTKKGAKTASAQALLNLLCSLADEFNQTVRDGDNNEIRGKIPNAIPERVASPAVLRQTPSPQSTSSTCPVPSPLPTMLPTTACPVPSPLPLSVNVIGSENHIGTLQELSVMRGWGMPHYVEESRGGASHMPTFQTSCTLLQFRTIGEAGTKKAAKKLAALKMLDLLIQTESSDAQSSAYEPPQQRAPTNYANTDIPIKTEVKDEHAEDILTDQPEVAYGMYQEVMANVKEDLTLSTTPEMLKLKIIGICRGTDHLQTLRELCQEQSIGLTITQIDDLNDDDLYQALVQLDFSVRDMGTLVVCLGAGKDLDSAEMNAARNALEYLKLMTRGCKVKSERNTKSQ